jgi:GNAT superfamily N-acetyltransferase
MSGELVKFVVGCDFAEFKRYLRRIGLYKEEGELEKLETLLMNKLLNLVVWRENGEIIGHAIWHETNTEEHRKGDPRDKEDREILEKLLGGKKSFVELHEVWLMEEHRGKGYGKQFFEFFEEFMRNNGYDKIIYYAYHPAAIAICRQRGCNEAYGIEETGPKGEVEKCYVFYLSLKNNLHG